MQAIEFETVVQNRNIYIPNQYALNKQKVRVIVLSGLEFINEPKRDKSQQTQMKLTSLIALAKGKGCFKSVSEINEFIRNERNQWG